MKRKRSKTSPTSVPSPEWLKKFRETLLPYALRGNYRGGLKLAKEALREFPESMDVRYQYAKLLGDGADELSGARKVSAKREATSILKAIVRQLSGRSPEFRFGVCINYYYQKQDYRGMHRFGQRVARAGDRKGYYAQGVAGAFQAMQAREKKDVRSELHWARSAKRAWIRYGLKGDDYYFGHYCMALALAILGEKAAALANLNEAARVSQRKVTDWEFRDVLEILRIGSKRPETNPS